VTAQASIDRLRRRSSAAAHRIDVVDSRSAARDAALSEAWIRLLDATPERDLLHESPEWADHLRSLGTRVDVAVVRRADHIVGIMPVAHHPFALTFEVAGMRAHVPFDASVVLGTALLPPDDESVRTATAEALFDASPGVDSILFDALSDRDPFWDLAGRSTPAFLGYRPLGPRRGYAIDVSGSFEDYVRELGSSIRYNTQRGIRKLREEAGGDLELVCFRSPEEAKVFFDEASAVRRRSWQHAVVGGLGNEALANLDAVSDLARRGLFRSYVLRSRGEPCAFALGYQYRDAYYYAVAGYDGRFARHSPGAALLYLLLEDVFTRDRPRVVTLGLGDEEYKRKFGTTERAAGRCFLFRPTLRNSARIRSHDVFSRVTKSWASALGRTKKPAT
jgi:CelD/BcsL family acetyltransferase involved in cellulose biosynthesis